MKGTTLRTESGQLRSIWRVLIFILAFVVASIPPSVLASPFVRSPGSGRIDIANAFVEAIGALGATWFMLGVIEKRGWGIVGLGKADARPAGLGIGFLIGGGTIGAAILALIAAGWLKLEHLPTVAAGHPIIGMTVLLLPAALAEEVLMRGYLLTVIGEAVNWPFAVAVTSIGFGLLHAANPGADVQSVTLVTIAGIFLATIRIVTGSLYVAWSAHFAWNWVMAALFHLSVSGVAFAAPGYRYVDAGPDWATGGQWGPEGGIFAGVAMVAAILLMWKRPFLVGTSRSWFMVPGSLGGTKNEEP